MDEDDLLRARVWITLPFFIRKAHIRPQKRVHQTVDGFAFALCVRFYGLFPALWDDNAETVIILCVVLVFRPCGSFSLRFTHKITTFSR